jgi:hypothetical protein
MRAKLAWAFVAATMAAGPDPAWAQERTTTAISDIRQESNERQTRLTVECTGPLAYTYYSPDPLTLVVDIPEMDASAVPSRINVGSREVESIRVASMARADGRSLARLEVRLASLAPYQIYSWQGLNSSSAPGHPVAPGQPRRAGCGAAPCDPVARSRRQRRPSVSPGQGRRGRSPAPGSGGHHAARLARPPRVRPSSRPTLKMRPSPGGGRRPLMVTARRTAVRHPGSLPGTLTDWS